MPYSVIDKKVLLITPGQPALNPRLIKEADALADAGYQVTVMYAYRNTWGDDFTDKLLQTKKWKAIRAGGHPVKEPLIYFLSRIIYKLANLLFKKRYFLKHIAAYAAARSSFFLIRKAMSSKSDLYIAHNLGALAPAVLAAKKHQAKCGFDAEDFHRQEVDDHIGSLNFMLGRYLEDKYITMTDYMTASSPQIAKAYHNIYPQTTPYTLLNVFTKIHTTKVRCINKTGKIKIFWFSQTIGHNRGLEDIAAALRLLEPGNFELHLLGHIDDHTKQEFVKSVFPGLHDIYFYAPVPPDKIIAFAAQFDIGLASEQKEPLNRDLCLSNKIFTYMQAGLALIASDTTAQKELLNTYPSVGKLYQTGHTNSLSGLLLYYQQNRDKLYEAQKASLRLAHEELNWETEGRKFLNIIHETLSAH